MSVLQDLTSQHIQGGHVIIIVGHLLHSMWVSLNTVECVAGHWLTGLVITTLLQGTIGEGKVLMVTMWMV